MSTNPDSVEHLVAPASVVDITAEPLKSLDVWRDLAEVFQQVFTANINQPIKDLEHIRFLAPNTDVEVLRRTVRMLGFDLSQDLMEFSSSKLLKVIPQLALYPESNSSTQFVKFFDFLLNASTEVEYLYTEDYANFYTQPQGTLITEGGSWYKTTHINLFMALFITTEQLKNVNLTNGSFKDRILEVFYEYAPAPLVVHRFCFEYKETIKIGVAAEVVNHVLKFAEV